MVIESPFEILELQPGERVSLLIEGYEEAEVNIKPARAPGGVTVTDMRVYLPPHTKSVGPPYYDITSKTLRAQLIGYLRSGDFRGKVFTITKWGTEPAARFSLEVRPLGPGEQIRSLLKRFGGS